MAKVKLEILRGGGGGPTKIPSMGRYGYYLEPHIPMWRTGIMTVFGFQNHGKEIGHGFLLCFVDKITDKIV